MELKNKKILVVGLARTGVAVARFLAEQGAQVTVTDMKDEAAVCPLSGETGRACRSTTSLGGMTSTPF